MGCTFEFCLRFPIQVCVFCAYQFSFNPFTTVAGILLLPLFYSEGNSDNKEIKFSMGMIMTFSKKATSETQHQYRRTAVTNFYQLCD